MKALKIGLSVFLVYHLITVLLLPVASSLAGRRLARYFIPYANTLGFNTTWQFFSPAPSPMFYLEYELETGADDEVPETKTYPPARKGHTWDEGWSRRLFGMRFFALNEERLENYFVPFLCRENPTAKSVVIQAVFEKIEDVERVGEYAEFKDMAERIDLPRRRYACPEGARG